MGREFCGCSKGKDARGCVFFAGAFFRVRTLGAILRGARERWIYGLLASGSHGSWRASASVRCRAWSQVADYFVDLPISFSPPLLVGLLVRGFRAIGLWRPASEGADPITVWHALGMGAKLSVIFGYLLRQQLGTPPFER
jgi:hypothetical protein